MSFTLYDFQKLAADLGLYKSGIDGQWGPATKAAMDILTTGREEIRSWPRERIIVAGVQLALVKLGYNPGTIDGYYGGLSKSAYDAWAYKKAYGKKEKLDTTVVTPTPVGSPFPSQKNVAKFYGQPGPQVQSQLVTIIPPYEMVLDWNLNQKVTKITLHKKCADSALSALIEIEQHYGQEAIIRLGLNRFAGSYVHRQMRGGTSWSMHAYGCAIDFYAGPNDLRTRCPQALFCAPEYTDWFDIWEKHGATSLGRAIGRDWMHIQFASL